MKTFYEVNYLGHSAWLLETSGHYFLFDCQDATDVDLNRLTDKPVFMLFSHFHHDHYSKKLHKKSAESGIGFVILGDFTARFETNNTAVMHPHEQKDFNGVTVYTADSSDAGVCYLVQADGLNIFFAGDHADWADGDPNNGIYYKEIDYVAGLGFAVDIAFIPVCTFGGTRPEALTKGAVYAVEKLNPAVTYPMHGNGREWLYKEFEKDLRAAGNTAEVVCAG